VLISIRFRAEAALCKLSHQDLDYRFIQPTNFSAVIDQQRLSNNCWRHELARLHIESVVYCTTIYDQSYSVVFMAHLLEIHLVKKYYAYF